MSWSDNRGTFAEEARDECGSATYAFMCIVGLLVLCALVLGPEAIALIHAIHSVNAVTQ